MKKGPKIIQISGLRGLIFAGFIVTCLAAGFILFPAKVAMYLWNYMASTYFAVPEISLWQGVLLWAIIALSIYTFNNNRLAISFKQPMELNEEEMRILMDRIKMQKQAQKLNTMILKAEDFNKMLQQNEKTEKNEEKQESSSNINEKHF